MATSSHSSKPGPPSLLDQTIAPEPSSFVTKPSDCPPEIGWNGLAVGKPDPAVEPTTTTRPDASTASPRPMSCPAPPRKVEYCSAPVASNAVTNASDEPPKTRCAAPAVVGKPDDSVVPVTKTRPSRNARSMRE